MTMAATVTAAPALTVTDLLRRLEEGVAAVQDSASWAHYLAAMARLHSYSTVAVGYSKSGNARVGRGDRRGAYRPYVVT